MKVYYPKYRIQLEEIGSIKEPDQVKVFTNNYKKSSDIYLEFIDDQLELTKSDKDFESFELLFLTYKSWYAEAHSTRPKGGKKELIAYLGKNGYKIDKRNMYGVKIKSIVAEKDDLDGDNK